MADKNLQSFKISDKQKAQVKAPQAKEVAEEASFSMGFARIEALLDEAQPGEVSERMSRILQDLDTLQTGAKTARDKAAAKKARAAVERTVDLLDYLFRTKAAMAQSLEKPSK